ncbi:MAG: hypothetical protein HKN14_08840 [Marinicaulis sp.]|nr:hypothetical protein [Marinicaulis sp.]
MIASAVYVFFLTALWQGAIITAATFAAVRIFRIADASSRANIWSMAFFASVVLPFSIFLPGAGIEISPPGDAQEKEFVTLAAPAAYEFFHTSTSGPRRVIGYHDLIAPVFLLFWIAGALWRTTGLALDAAAMEKMRRESVRLSGAKFGLPENTDIRLHASLSSPIAAGLFRPSIILPAAIFEESCDALRGAVAHEFAHVKRGDLVSNCAEAAVLCLFWWNPSLYFIRNAIAENREMACDDHAVMQTKNTGEYASALVSCAERAMTPGLTTHALATSLGVAGGPSGLGRRLARLADGNYTPQKRTARSRLLLAGAAIAAVTTCAAAAAPRVDVKSFAAASPFARAAPRSHSERLGRELVEAVIDDDIARAENLLANGADIDAVLEGDGTPLIAAVNNDCFGFASWLIANGANVDAYARYDETALISAVRNSDAVMVRLLITAGANVNLTAKTETGKLRSPLGEARRQGRREIAQLLISRGAVQ